MRLSLMNHKENCPIERAQQGSWCSTQKPYCNCGGNAIADSNPDNFKSAIPLIHPYNCKHDWRSHKTAEGMMTCDKCGQMENIEQVSLTPTGEQESGCEHKFVFSHKEQEGVGMQAIYQTVIYVICPKCGLVKTQ